MEIKLYIFLLLLLASCSQKVAPLQQPTVKSVKDLQGIKTLPFVVDDRPMRQLLINQTQAIAVQGKISGLSSLQNRRRLQSDLDRLRQKQNATQADYQYLLRRVEITRQVELNVLRNIEVTHTTPPRIHRPSSRQMAPPPKTVAISMPSNAPGSAPKANQDTRPIKLPISLQNSPGKPKSVKAFKTI